MFQPNPINPVPGGNENAQALQSMGFENLIQNFDTLAWVVFITLVLMSIFSWYYIIVNLLRHALMRSKADKVINQFWNARSAQDAIREMEKQGKNEPFSKVALEAAAAAQHHQRSEGNRLAETLNRSEFIDRALRQSIAKQSVHMESGLTLLATVGSAAVYVGLLGTVWGIYHALIRIGVTGEASIGAVAGPVGEALIMTAIGLGTAIPAVFMFNFFVRMNRVVYARMDEFAHDLHDFFSTGSRLGSNAGERVAGGTKAGAPAAAAAKK